MIRRVFNAYLAEARKLSRRAIGYAAFGFALVTILATAGLERVGEAATRLSGGAAGATSGFVALADGLARGTGAGAILLVIFAGVFMAEETELGTSKILFSKPIRRGEVVLAKGLLLLTLAVLLVAVVAVASTAMAGALFGLDDVVDRDSSGDVLFVHHTSGEMIGHVLRAIPQLVPPLFATLLLAFLMSALTEQSGIAVGLSFASLLVLLLGSSFYRRAEPFLVTSYFGFATDTLRSFALGEATAEWGVRWPGGPPKLVTGLIVSALTAGAAWLVAGIAVARRAILAVAIGASLAVAFSSGDARAGEPRPIEFTVQELNVTGQVWDVQATDLDGDGKKDLVVFSVTGRHGPAPRRFLSIFYGGGAKGFEKVPSQVIEVEGDACVRFVADVDPSAKGLELGFIGPRGAYCYSARDRVYDTAHPRALLRDEGFFDISAGTQLPSWDGLVRDVDKDGRADIVFPKKGALALYLQQKDGSFVHAAELPLEYKEQFGTHIETLVLNRFVNYWAALSKPVLVDLRGTGALDIVTYREAGLDFWIEGTAKKPGRIFPEDPTRRMPLKIMKEEPSEPDEGFNSVNGVFRDVDGDGLPDLVLYRNLGKIGFFESMRTQILLYRSRGAKEGFQGDRPDQVLNLRGVSINPTLIDVDGDGAKDLVVSSLRTDLITNAKRALFSSVDVTYYVFLYRKDAHRFSETPDYTKDLAIDVSRIEGGGTIPLALFEGDFDGDGLPDLLSLASNEEVEILPGHVERSFFSGERLDYGAGRRVAVKIETSNSIRIDDLNGDGRSDFLFFYFDKNWEAKERGIIRVALSR